MNQTKMIERVKENGLNMSIPLLYRTGLRFGFLIKNENARKEKYIVDEPKFEEWLKVMTNPSNKDWISVKDICNTYDIQYSTVKYHILKNNIETRNMGFLRGGMVHVRRSDAETIVSICGKKFNKE